MKWSLINKVANPSLDGLVYENRRVRQYIREEGQYRCVWCAIPEASLGGFQAFHTEHYKPQSLYPSLVDSLENLFYACPICGRFKSNDWPADPVPDHSVDCYPNPSVVDYTTLFSVDENSGLVEGLFIASKYMVEKLWFNRPQLILERKRYYLNQKLTTLVEGNRSLNSQLANRGDAQAISYITAMSNLQGRLIDLRTKFENIPPYELADVSRG